MSLAKITAHMVVKNEDCFVWYAIKSVLPYVDRFLVTDTGSTDHTLALISSIKDQKLILNRTKISTPHELTAIRQAQLEDTKTDWIWVVDGDEIYPKRTAKEVVAATKAGYEGIVVRRFDLLGDIYHRQDERVGEYRQFNKRGHFASRLVNKQRIKGLHYRGDYPLEGFYDQEGTSTLQHDPLRWYFSKNHLYHAMYLRRSSEGHNLKSVFHRHKFKHELGLPLTSSYPEVFDEKPPVRVPDPRLPRSLSYRVLSSIITPMKIIKRELS